MVDVKYKWSRIEKYGLGDASHVIYGDAISRLSLSISMRGPVSRGPFHDPNPQPTAKATEMNIPNKFLSNTRIQPSPNQSHSQQKPHP